MAFFPLLNVTPNSATHVNDIGQVMDVVLEDGGIGGLQGQQILVPGFKSLQFVLRVLCFSLKQQTKKGEIVILF